MISVMIVEDEPPILRSIRDSISSANPNFKITSLAYNGQQAIDILKEDCPDVIFTDIRMPGIDGIGLLTYIKEKNLDIISVVLSGYKDFEYAKKAISLGVNEYLLKPVAMNELNNLINRIEEKINCKKDFAERSYLYNTLNNNASSQKNNKVKLKYKSYLLMLVCAGSYQIATSDYVAACSDYWKSEDRECVVKRSLNFDGKVWFFDGNSSVEKIILFALNENSDKIVNRISQNVFSELAVSSIPITIVISSLFKTVTDMSHMSRLLRITLRKKIVVGLSQIIKQYDMEYNIQNNQKEIPLLDSYTENKLVFSMKNSNTQEFKTDLKRLFQVWEESKYPQIWVEKLLKYIITLCQRVLPHYSQKDFFELGIAGR
jgi:two-component system response regulator YesN